MPISRITALFVVLAVSSETIAAQTPTLIAEWTAPTEDVAVLRDASGNGHDLTLHGVTLFHRQEDLGDHPHLFFDGDDSYAEVDASPNLNPQHVTIGLWFRAEDTAIQSQVPLLVKSLPQHADPWYQYGLFLMDTVDHPEAVIFYVSVQGRTVIAEAQSTNLGTNWNHVAATYDAPLRACS